MFSYSFKIRRINTASKLKAFVTIIIDDVLEVDGFKVIDGAKGLFVSAPSHKGTVNEDGQQVEKWFDDVRFVGENGMDVGDEIKRAIIEQFNSDSYSSNRSSAAAAHTNNSSSGSAPSSSRPSNSRKPLW